MTESIFEVMAVSIVEMPVVAQRIRIELRVGINEAGIRINVVQLRYFITICTSSITDISSMIIIDLLICETYEYLKKE